MLIRVVDLEFKRCRRRTEKFSDLIYENRMSSIQFSFLFRNENRMTAPSGCHFQIKWIFFKWQPIVILFWNDNRMTYSSGYHFFWNVNRMKMSFNSYFFTRINRTESIIKLKFYIRVEDEFVRKKYHLNGFLGPYTLPTESLALFWITKKEMWIQ